MKNNKIQSSSAQLIAVASCSLLAGLSSGEVFSEEGQSKWDVGAAVLSYSESGRINVNQSLLNISHSSDKRIVSAKFDADTVSGPSENGATPNNTSHTMTSPSGNSDATYSAGESPYWQVENHNRYSAGFNVNEIVSSKYTVLYGARYSYEHSYISKSAHLGFIKNINKKNTELSFDFAYERAKVAPLGGIVKAGERTILSSDYGTEEEFDSAWSGLHDGTEKNKNVTEVKFSLSQVINKNMIANLGYSFGTVRGYQTDALKLVSVVDESGASIAHLFERRPEKRFKNVAYLNTKYSMNNDTVLGFKYRYYSDSWGVRSSTVQLGLQYQLTKRWNVEPTARVYQQSKADFYKHSVFEENESEERHEAMSADYRLGEMVNYTFGINLKYQMDNGDKLNLRLAKYKIQSYDQDSSKRGFLNERDISPDIDATMLMLSYEF